MKALGILLLFGVWVVVSGVWYVCGIKGLCTKETHNVAQESPTAEKPAPISATPAENAAEQPADDLAHLVDDGLFFRYNETSVLMSNGDGFRSNLATTLAKKPGHVVEIVGRFINGEDQAVGLARAKATQAFLGVSDAQVLLGSTRVNVGPSMLERAKNAPFEGATIHVFEKQRSDFMVEESVDDGPATVFFPFGSADAGNRESLKEALKEIAQGITGGTTAIVNGHTDNTGDPEFNLTLGQKRADFIKEVLVDAGALPDNITATSAGQSRPIADNATMYGREQNRRVEIAIQ